MPEGVMEWFDPSTCTGRIAKDGHRFTVSSGDVQRAHKSLVRVCISTSTATSPARHAT
jgi:hypothetical protein